MPTNPIYPKLSSLVSINELPDQLGFVKTDNPSPANIAGDAREGSGGDYLSNEIFYRVSLIRKNFNPTFSSGHLHLPLMQSRNPFIVNAARNQIVTKDFVAGNTNNMILKIIQLLKQSVQ